MTRPFHSDRWLYVVLALVFFPAFLINLGLLPLIDDEGIRALVGMEMSWRDNYITPTLHGAYYYNKPPLWNWILLGSFELFGEVTEFTVRFPSVIMLIGFAATVYYFCRKHFPPTIALLNTLILLCTGRMLFWESMLGLIDIAFSWVIFTLFMVIYHEGEKQRWWRLFLLSYTLMAIAFLLKGLPAIVFQGITLLTYLVYKKQWLRLFSLPHIVSGLVGVLLIGSYYAVYHQYNDLAEVFTKLFTESSKRTVAAHSFGDTLLHIAGFPLEVLYHFLPWTILVFLLLKKGTWQRIRQHHFAQYCLWILLLNSIIYWLSPNFYPRYILMLTPLLFIALLSTYEWHQKEKSRVYEIIRKGLGVLLILITLGWLAPMFIERSAIIPGRVWKSLVVVSALAALCWAYWKQPQRHLLIFALAMLVFRVGFNWFVLPDRSANDFGEDVKASSIEVGERWSDRPLSIFHETLMQPANSFYLERAQNGIIPRDSSFQLGKHYIFSPDQYDPVLFTPLVDSFYVRHGANKVFYIGPLQSDDPAIIEEHTLIDAPSL